jgi:formylglycine-generating enzyme required for sulfatase activity
VLKNLLKTLIVLALLGVVGAAGFNYRNALRELVWPQPPPVVPEPFAADPDIEPTPAKDDTAARERERVAKEKDEADRRERERLAAEKEKEEADRKERERLALLDARRKQQEEARNRVVTNSVGMRLVPIPAGSFMMGADSPDSPYDSPPHRVRISRRFYLGETEVTQSQWLAVMRSEPTGWFSSEGEGKEAVKGLDTATHPMESVSWRHAARFCNALSARENLPPYYSIDGDRVTIHNPSGPGYRLPTEAEWEYAARANAAARSTWSFGNGEDQLARFAWFVNNSQERTHPARDREPNGFKLYGLYGNVAEWCDDWDTAYPRGAGVEVRDPQGPPAGTRRVVRGGGWNSLAGDTGSARRASLLPDQRSDDTGSAWREPRREQRAGPGPVPVGCVGRPT